MNHPRPILVVAGSDNSAGAGLQADLKTLTALGCYTATVLSAITAQSSKGVVGAWYVTPEQLEAQLTCVSQDFAIQAVKIGMLGAPELTEMLAAWLTYARPEIVVLDPVLTATSGGQLARASYIKALKSYLLSLVSVITPNASEAAALLEVSEQEVLAYPQDACSEIAKLGCRAVVLTGGGNASAIANFASASRTPLCIDYVYSPLGFSEVTSVRIETMHTHGTGCSFASALTAHLAFGENLVDAVCSAKKFVIHALRYAAPPVKPGVVGGVDQFCACRQYIVDGNGGLPEPEIKVTNI